MRYALAFLLISCVRLVSADDIDMTYSDCVASWGEPDSVAMDMVNDPNVKTVNFTWRGGRRGAPNHQLHFIEEIVCEFIKAPDPEWKGLKPESVNYRFNFGMQYQDILAFNKGASEWEGEDDHVVNIAEPGIDPRTWKRKDGRASATLLTKVHLNSLGKLVWEWQLTVRHLSDAEMNAADKQVQPLDLKATVLSPEQAKNVVGNAPNHNNGPDYSESWGSKVGLKLDSLTTLDPKTTHVLSQYDGILSLNGLTTISAEVATILAQGKTALRLDTAEPLSVDVCKQLSNYEGRLFLRLDDEEKSALFGLANFRGKDLHLNFLEPDIDFVLNSEDADIVMEFVRHGNLEFIGHIVTFINFDLAKAIVDNPLIKRKSSLLNFCKVKHLDADVARELVKNNYEKLDLSGLAAINSQLAKELINYKGLLDLGDSTAVSYEAAEVFAIWCNSDPFLGQEALGEDYTFSPFSDPTESSVDQLHEDGRWKLRSLEKYEELSEQNETEQDSMVFEQSESAKSKIDKTIAQELCNSAGSELVLSDLTHFTLISKEGAQELAKFQGDRLQLLQLHEIDKAVAQELAEFSGRELALGPSKIKDVATELAQSKANELVLYVQSMDRETAQQLANFRGQRLSLSVPLIERETAQQLVKFQGQKLWLSLQSIDRDVAQQLANFRGQELWLSLQSIDREVAQQLASFGKHDGGCRLHLNGLNQITKDVAQELAKFRGDTLDFWKLTEIDKEAAQELAKFQGDVLNFWDLTAINRETAQELAQFGGTRLSLKQLASIDEKAAQELKRFSGDLNFFDEVTSQEKDLAQNTTTQQTADDKNKPIEMVNDPRKMQEVVQPIQGVRSKAPGGIKLKFHIADKAKLAKRNPKEIFIAWGTDEETVCKQLQPEMEFPWASTIVTNGESSIVIGLSDKYVIGEGTDNIFNGGLGGPGDWFPTLNIIWKKYKYTTLEFYKDRFYGYQIFFDPSVYDKVLPAFEKSLGPASEEKNGVLANALGGEWDWESKHWVFDDGVSVFIQNRGAQDKWTLGIIDVVKKDLLPPKNNKPQATTPF